MGVMVQNIVARFNDSRCRCHSKRQRHSAKG